MSAAERPSTTTDRHLRRDAVAPGFVKGGGALVVGLSLVGAGVGAKAAKPRPQRRSMPTPPVRLVARDPCRQHDHDPHGQGRVRPGLGQHRLRADHRRGAQRSVLRDHERLMGDTDRTPGGGSRPASWARGNPNPRKVAAYVYQALLSLASTQLGVPVGEPEREERRHLGRRQEPDLRPARHEPGAEPDDPGHRRSEPFGLTVAGNPPTKPVSEYKVVGQSIPMRTIPPIVAGTATFVGDVRLPGMLHARVVHPPGSARRSLGRDARQEAVPEHRRSW